MQITKTKDEKKPNMDCVNLLTSVLIYYPEISKISIEPDEKIYINYIIQKILEQKIPHVLLEYISCYQMTN